MIELEIQVLASLDGCRLKACAAASPPTIGIKLPLIGVAESLSQVSKFRHSRGHDLIKLWERRSYRCIGPKVGES